jgi:hypothetical protein
MRAFLLGFSVLAAFSESDLPLLVAAAASMPIADHGRYDDCVRER